MEEGLGGDVVPLRISRIVPVFHQRAKHGPSFPPIIWVGEIAWDVAGSVTRVVLEHPGGGGFGRFLEGFCDSELLLTVLAYRGGVPLLSRSRDMEACAS